MRLDDIPNAQSVDIRAREPAREAAAAAFAAELARGVGVHGVAVVVLFQREGVVVGVALREADAVGSFGAGDDDFLDAEFAGGFDDVVGAEDVAAEAFAVRDEHVARVGGEVDDGIWRLDWYGGGVAGIGVVVDVEVGGEGVEDLAGVGEVRFEGVDGGVFEGGEVEVEDGVAARKEVGDYVAACFPGSAGEDDALGF